MKLVLSENHSISQRIAKILGDPTGEDGYIKGNGCIVSWCVRHPLKLSQPAANQ